MILTILSFCTSLSVPPIQGKEKDTFSISLVQQATVKRMQEKEVVYENYKVKKGDFIYKLLRQRGLLKKPELPELMSLLKTMNKSLKNLDLIHPGQTILIPLKIVPIKGSKKVDQESVMDVASPEEIKFDNYVVKPGDSLAMIVKNRFKMSPEYFYDHYLKLVQKFNPTLTNPDLIYPRQVIRLPIYSPEIVRMPIKTEKKGTVAEKSKMTPDRDSQQTLALRQ